jgi:hypothetical protein
VIGRRGLQLARFAHGTSINDLRHSNGHEVGPTLTPSRAPLVKPVHAGRTGQAASHCRDAGSPYASGQVAEFGDNCWKGWPRSITITLMRAVPDTQTLEKLKQNQ